MNPQQTSGWGRFPVCEAVRRRARSREDLVRHAGQTGGQLAQGNCRSYGDACLSRQIVSTLPLDRFLAFDSSRGTLKAEAGLILGDLLRLTVPRGWFLPVTPGTRYPTLGGCVAADVHGKNHHVDGSFGAFVEELEMVLADGSVARCTPDMRPDLFRATLGGMGLTGFIYAVALRLRRVESSYLRVRTVRTGSLVETCRALLDTQADHAYSVAWIDLLCSRKRRGRGLVMLGNHAPAEDVPDADRLALHPSPRLGLPAWFPGVLVNVLTARVFNELYYHRQWRTSSEDLVHYNPFFYPLDAVADWNRVYGRRGLIQYQFAIPFGDGMGILAEVLDRLGGIGPGSTLAVLKTFGPQDGILSFPMPGYTLAMDFPAGCPQLTAELGRITDLLVENGGRMYLAKDAIMTREQFEPMYPRLDEFRRIRRHWDPEGIFRSLQSDRLGLT